jgi:hypothetical protein
MWVPVGRYLILQNKTKQNKTKQVKSIRIKKENSDENKLNKAK